MQFSDGVGKQRRKLRFEGPGSGRDGKFKQMCLTSYSPLLQGNICERLRVGAKYCFAKPFGVPKGMILLSSHLGSQKLRFGKGCQ